MLRVSWVMGLLTAMVLIVGLPAWNAEVTVSDLTSETLLVVVDTLPPDPEINMWNYEDPQDPWNKGHTGSDGRSFFEEELEWDEAGAWICPDSDHSGWAPGAIGSTSVPPTDQDHEDCHTGGGS